MLEGLLAADPQDVVRHQRAFDQRVARLDVVAGVDEQVLVLRDVVLLLHAASLLTMMVILPRRLSARISTLPEISAMTAGSLGLRASKISVTRGRPPVMSCVPEASRGWRAEQLAGHDVLAFLDLDAGLGGR